MKSRMRGWLALGALAACVSTGAGCSRNGTESPPEKAVPAAAPTPPKPLRVALAGSYVPLHFQRAGQMEGLEADLARLIGQQLGRPVEFINPRSLSLDSVSAIAQVYPHWPSPSPRARPPPTMRCCAGSSPGSPS